RQMCIRDRSLWDALRMNMMISYQELVRTFPKLRSERLFYVRAFTVVCNLSRTKLTTCKNRWY
ncbi:hypothetical protein ET136_14630, partial [Klebsiella pneumoniae]